jgi:hypothetical protein
MSQSHPLVDSHPYARRERIKPAPSSVLWGTHHINGNPILLRHQRPRASWPGYPSGMCPPDVAKALRQLAKGMLARGHVLRCNCIGRDPEQDAQFRGQGGKAAHSPATWSSSSVGWHLSGRAVDVTLPGEYNTGHAEREAMVADLLAIGKPLGWTPIAGEDWHIERRGPWSALSAARGTREGGLAALLDVGGWRGDRWEWRAVQAQLWRVGIDSGGLDGWPGTNTYAAITDAGLPSNGAPEELLPDLYEMPDNGTAFA